MRALHALATAGVVPIALSGLAAYKWLIQHGIPVLPLSSAVNGFVPVAIYFLIAFNTVATLLRRIRGRPEHEVLYRAYSGLASAILLSAMSVFFILTQFTHDPAVGSLTALYLFGPFCIFPFAIGVGAILGGLLGTLLCRVSRRL